MGIPNKQDLKTTTEVIEWLKEYTEQNEPFATSFIDACEIVLSSMPEVDDLNIQENNP